MQRTQETFRTFALAIADSGLEPEVRLICKKHFVTIHDVYENHPGPNVAAARMHLWFWLTHARRRSSSEIGRLFDRTPTAITHALRRVKMGAAAFEQKLEAPEYEALEVVCRRTAHASADRRSAAGKLASERAQLKRGNSR